MFSIIIILSDALINLNTGIYLKGELILCKKLIIKKYFKNGYFIFDIVTLVPIAYNILSFHNHYPILS